MGLSLEELRRKINLELDEVTPITETSGKAIDRPSWPGEGEDLPDEEEDKSEKSAKKKSLLKSRVRLENENKIAGMIEKLDYRLDFSDLAEKLNQIEGMNVTRAKAKRVFNAIRGMMGF